MPNTCNISKCVVILVVMVSAGLFAGYSALHGMLKQAVAYLLPGLLIFLMAPRLIGVFLKRQEIFRFLSQHRKRVLIIVLATIFLLVDLPFLISQNPNIGSPKWTYWTQTFAGNWNADEPPVSGYWYAFSVVLAILLNNSFFVVIMGLIWQLMSEREKAMKALDTAAALIMRDSFAKVAAHELAAENFPTTDKDIDVLFTAAIAKGQADLEKHLPSVTKEADEIISALRGAGRKREEQLQRNKEQPQRSVASVGSATNS